ncbi:MAG TPA: cation diffusion facilitator family transporter [Rhizomicrobium sp.]|jgi:ferrous-iron efflux pump FieF|nr:cation diffusion facilitator family transporter [Rhizomicrobium sp.]
MAGDAHDAAGAALMRRAAWASLAVSLLLTVLKLGAFLVSNSVAMLASFADSAMDLFTSTLNLLAIRSSLQPADREHRFGHGKAEPLAGMAQFAFIAGSAVFLTMQGIGRLLYPEAIGDPRLALAVLAIGIVAAIGLIVYQRRVVRATGSLAIGADSQHYVGDLITNAGVVAAIVLTKWLGWPLADPLIALGVAAMLVWTAFGVFRASYDQLMDRELPDADRARIKAIVLAHPEVTALHDLRSRAAGAGAFIQLHIELDGAMSLLRAHQISDEVEAELCGAFPHAEVIIHQDPAGIEPAAPLAAH